MLKAVQTFLSMAVVMGLLGGVIRDSNFSSFNEGTMENLIKAIGETFTHF